MNAIAVNDELKVLNREMQDLRERFIKAHQARGPEPVSNDYAFTDTGGDKVSLLDLFAEHDDLIVVHNMGRKCSYCALWADGFIGLYPHLKRRCAFVLSSPDPWSTLRDVAKGRGWPFPCVSSDGNTFTKDMGFVDEKSGGMLPGASAFTKRDDGSVVRVSTTPFGPGDLFCPVWHFFDMLPDGPATFEPK